MSPADNTLPAATREARPRICFVGYPQLRAFAAPVLAEYANRAQVEVLDRTFDDAVAAARERINEGSVDAFVSAGSNAMILRSAIEAPVAAVEVSGYDLLQALMKAKQLSSRVGVVTYGRTIPELEDVRALINIEIIQHAYVTPDDARSCFELLRKGGVTVIIGSSLVVDLAQQAGLHGLLSYSLESVRKGFDTALELARVARLEASRYDQLNSVLQSLQEAVVAVDLRNRITAINPPMRHIVGGDRARLMGERLDVVQPELSLGRTLETGQPERGVVQRILRRDWVVNRTPIHEHGRLVGAAVTLYDPSAVREADANLRKQMRKSQHHAHHRFGQLVGSSEAFIKARDIARRYAVTDSSVLILGESGVGKELFAQSIHNESRRARGPFVAVNCASFPESLLESELFGHEEGAFTGARRGGRPGLFETAHMGTIFLDEIGDMPTHLQTRLLRVLQEREVTRLGAAAPIPIDVRIIAASHQPLAELIVQRRFRQDLYYRLSTLRLSLPALRERGDDVLELARNFVGKSLQRMELDADAQKQADEAVTTLSPWLAEYAWPGNVRELENVSERIALSVAANGGATGLVEMVRHECPEIFALSGAPATAAPTRARVVEVLAQCGGNRQVAAARLGISRSTLWRWLKAPG